jgi:hypothetical protein
MNGAGIVYRGSWCGLKNEASDVEDIEKVGTCYVGGR